MRTATRRTAIVAATVAGLAVTGVAFAAWTSTGTGTATATAGHAQNLVVDGADDVTGLFPTGSVTVPVTVTNPNPYKVKLSSLTFDSATTTKAGCDASVVTAPSQSPTNELAANNGSATIDVTVSMSNAAANECQGAAFTLNFTATGASAS
jgi:hypothetical protein